MTKFEIIQALEGKLIPTPGGNWHKVENGRYHTGYGWANLRLFEIGYLEKLYLAASEAELKTWRAKNQRKLIYELLTKNLIRRIRNVPYSN